MTKPAKQEAASKEPIRVFVVVQGGCIHSVFADQPIKFLLADWDWVKHGDDPGVPYAEVSAYGDTKADVDVALAIAVKGYNEEVSKLPR